MRTMYAIVGCLGLAAWPASALDPQTFHFMQIEVAIGGVEGDTTAQAIQLRMRSAGQGLVSAAKLVAYDAAGLNPVLIVDMESNVANATGGDNVLIVSAAMAGYTSPPVVGDFVMQNTIPESYLAAGRLTFETDNGAIIYWSLAWGGAGYTGSNLGATDNDLDGNFGPPFGSPLPSTTLSALRFNKAFNQRSTNNAADYNVDPGASVLRNNQRNTFTIISGACQNDCDDDGVCDEDEDDCNANGTPDDCEAFEDCDGNGVPDECDPDCDGDGVPDACDAVRDCDGNGVDDACDPGFCPCDIAGPVGTLNVFDFLQFQTYFGENDPCGDLTGEGTLNVFDFLEFQTCFGENCGR